jgi:hypothetical protein
MFRARLADRLQKAVIDIDNGAHVILTGLTVSGPGPGPFHSLTYGILVGGNADRVLHAARVTAVRDAPLSGIQAGIAHGLGGAAEGGGPVGGALPLGAGQEDRAAPKVKASGERSP